MKTIITNCNIASGGKIDYNCNLSIEDGVIQSVRNNADDMGGGDIYDLKGRYLCSGLIDLQINGAGGKLFQSDPNIDTLSTMASVLRRVGIAGFLPTITCASIEKISAAIEAVREYRTSIGGEVLGINLEGPMINSKKAGMANANEVRKIDDKLISVLSSFDNGVIYMTIAPEMIDSETAAKLRSIGVILALGHTTSSYDDVVNLKSHVTHGGHILNAMTGISGRDPGVAGAILDIDGMSTSIILDGYHIHEATARLIYRLMGATRLSLISDGMPPIGSDVTSFEYEGNMVKCKDGQCLTEDGVLAGTGVDVMTATRNAQQWFGIDFAEALRMSTEAPARVLELNEKRGSIETGKVADLAILDADFGCVGWVRGNEIELI